VATFVLASPAAAATPTQQPRRIVSLSPTATESLFAIGAGRQVIAVDNQSTYPTSAPKTDLSGFTPNVEAIAAYRPDLVVVQFDANGIVGALRRLGVPVLMQAPARSLSEAYAQIRQLGRVTGRRKSAAAVVARMQKRIATLVASSRARARGLTVFHEVSPDLYSATSRTFVGRVYALFGLRNIADAADSAAGGFPQLSPEYVIRADPHLIVLADTTCCGQTPQTVASRPGWRSVRAVRNGLIVRIDDSIASRWGPRIVNFVRAVASALSRRA
jgi:iron complex transport system substrate-binding protein